MIFPIELPHCIVCLKKQPGDPEHVIPQFLGGRLKAPILCNDCNHNLGSELISKAKTDPSIRLAFEALKNELPSLYWRTQDKAPFFGLASDGSKIKVSRRRHGLKVLPSRGQGGSIILDTKEASRYLHTVLQKYGATEKQETEIKTTFAQLEEEIPLELPTGHIIVKKYGPPLKPELSNELASDRMWTLLAYEFLSLFIGEHIYRKSFDPIRQYIRYGTTTDTTCVEYMSSNSQYEAFHALILEPMKTELKVRIRLFRWLVYLVTFRGIQLTGLDPIYFEDLKNRQSLFALSSLDARQGKWFIVQNAT